MVFLDKIAIVFLIVVIIGIIVTCIVNLKIQTDKKIETKINKLLYQDENENIIETKEEFIETKKESIKKENSLVVDNNNNENIKGSNYVEYNNLYNLKKLNKENGNIKNTPIGYNYVF